MRAKLKAFDSPDIADLENFKPEVSDMFGFLIQLYVGTTDSPDFEMFSTTICTPKWLQKRYDEDDILIGSRFILMFRYDYAQLVERLNRKISVIDGENWQEIALKVNVIARWEYEDYRN